MARQRAKEPLSLGISAAVASSTAGVSGSGRVGSPPGARLLAPHGFVIPPSPGG